MSDTPQFICNKCHRVYVREHAFMNHKCKQMKHEDEFKTIVGQSAWIYYQMWMKCKRRPIDLDNPSIFLSSSFFTTFIKFTKFIQKTKLPVPDKFIWLMVKKDIPPKMWTRDDVYSMYMDFIDSAMDPLVQIQTSINTLFDKSDIHNVDVSNVFEKIPPNELLHLIRLRQLSPWLLLFSKSFGVVIKNKMSSEQRIILETLIRPEYWGEKIGKLSPDTKEKIKQCVSELGI